MFKVHDYQNYTVCSWCFTSPAICSIPTKAVNVSDVITCFTYANLLYICIVCFYCNIIGRLNSLTTNCNVVLHVRHYEALVNLTVKFWKLNPATRKSSVPTLRPIALNRTACLLYNLTGRLKNVWAALHRCLSLCALTVHICFQLKYDIKKLFFSVHGMFSCSKVNI